MQWTQQSEGTALTRASDYMEANKAALGPVYTSDSAAQLRVAARQFGEHATAQQVATRSQRRHKEHERANTRVLRDELMVPVAAFASVRVATAPQLQELVVDARELTGHKLVAAGQAMAVAVANHLQLLVAAGFSADVAKQLHQAADALDQSVAACQNCKAVRAGATSGIKTQLAAGRVAIKLIDAALRRQLLGQPDLLRGWKVAKRIGLKPGTRSVPKEEVTGESDQSVTTPAAG